MCDVTRHENHPKHFYNTLKMSTDIPRDDACVPEPSLGVGKCPDHLKTIQQHCVCEVPPVRETYLGRTTQRTSVVNVSHSARTLAYI